jgi:2-keto-4-pentenoate hydratase/2-oxohepta-3-ene-1,7-dioic acid hydratase in catechol pathway
MREYFERGGADDTSERAALTDVRLRAPIVPKKFFHTAGNFREHEDESKQVDWSHAIAPWIVFFQNVDAIVGPDEPIIYPEHLTEELDYELELAIIIGRSGKFFGPDEAADYVAGYGLQRHHGPRHPAPGDAVRRVLVLQGDRHLLPDRPLDRDQGRGA